MIHILIAEADPMVAHILMKNISKLNHVQVHGPVSTSKDILKMVKKESINLILLDAYLPNESGLDVLKTLREEKYYQGVIMVTAANSVEEVKQAYAYGVTDYVIKPFEVARLDKAVKRYVAAMERLRDKTVLTQQDLDKEATFEAALQLPKGLNKGTYTRILENMKDSQKKSWTLKELAERTQISNVTVKKYMDYLEERGIVESQLNYGQIGRPEFCFFFKTQ